MVVPCSRPLVIACVSAIVLARSTLAAEPNPPASWGETTYVFGPEDSDLDIQSKVDAAWASNGGHYFHGGSPPNEYSDKRYAFLFKPGSYSVEVPVGYYTTVAGLGTSPDDVVMGSGGGKGVYCEEGSWDYRVGALDTFWRSMENFRSEANHAWFSNGGGQGTMWAVSQAAPLRRLHVTNTLWLFQYFDGNCSGVSCAGCPQCAAGQASGGFTANVQVDKDIESGSQQQWFSRNVETPQLKPSVWNSVTMGSKGGPPESCMPSGPQGQRLDIDKTPMVAEKPYIIVDPSDASKFQLVMPGIKCNSKGVSWGDLANKANLVEMEIEADGDSDASFLQLLAPNTREEVGVCLTCEEAAAKGGYCCIVGQRCQDGSWCCDCGATNCGCPLPGVPTPSSKPTPAPMPAPVPRPTPAPVPRPTDPPSPSPPPVPTPTQCVESADKAIDFERVYVAVAGDTAAAINAKLASEDVDAVVLSAGIYHLEDTLVISQSNFVVLGLGLATLIPTKGTAAITVRPGLSNVRLASVLLQGSELNSPVLLDWGKEGDTCWNCVISDLFARIGGPDGTADNPVSVDVFVHLRSGGIIGDNVWLWRADHTHGGAPTHPNENPCKTGLIVDGDSVTMYGLAVEHTLEDMTIWNGENGKTFFYQAELPYGVATSYGNADYVGYRVADNVKIHESYGVGVYHYFRDEAVTVETGIRVPSSVYHSMVAPLAVYLNGKGTMLHVINALGASTHAVAGQPGAHVAYTCFNMGGNGLYQPLVGAFPEAVYQPAHYSWPQIGVDAQSLAEDDDEVSELQSAWRTGREL